MFASNASTTNEKQQNQDNERTHQQQHPKTESSYLVLTTNAIDEILETSLSTTRILSPDCCSNINLINRISDSQHDKNDKSDIMTVLTDEADKNDTMTTTTTTTTITTTATNKPKQEEEEQQQQQQVQRLSQSQSFSQKTISSIDQRTRLPNVTNNINNDSPIDRNSYSSTNDDNTEHYSSQQGHIPKVENEALVPVVLQVPIVGKQSLESSSKPVTTQSTQETHNDKVPVLVVQNENDIGQLQLSTSSLNAINVVNPVVVVADIASSLASQTYNTSSATAAAVAPSSSSKVPMKRLSNWSNNLLRKVQSRAIAASATAASRNNTTVGTTNSELAFTDPDTKKGTSYNENDNDNDTVCTIDDSNNNVATSLSISSSSPSPLSFEQKVSTTFLAANKLRKKILLPSSRRIAIPSINDSKNTLLSSASASAEQIVSSPSTRNCVGTFGTSTAVWNNASKNDNEATIFREPCIAAVSSHNSSNISDSSDTFSVGLLLLDFPSHSNSITPTLLSSSSSSSNASDVKPTMQSSTMSYHHSENNKNEMMKKANNRINRSKVYSTKAIPLDAAVHQWIESMNALKDSTEMKTFIQSTLVVTSSTIYLVYWTVTLPVTVPYNICTSATSLLLNTSIDVLNTIIPSSLTTSESITKTSRRKSKKMDKNPIAVVSTIIQTVTDIPIFFCWTVPTTVVGIATDISSTVVSNTFDMIGLGGIVNNSNKYNPEECNDLHLHDSNNSSSSARALYNVSPTKAISTASQSSSNDFLDRLRLDFVPSERTVVDRDPNHKAVTYHASDCEVKRPNIHNAGDDVQRNDIKHLTKTVDVDRCMIDTDQPIYVDPVVAFKKTTSQYLLRISDIELYDNANDLVAYLDISDDTKSHRLLLRQALDRLIVRGLSMLANHPPARLRGKVYTTTPRTEIKWNPLNSTKNLVGRMVQMTDPTDRIHLLEKETLIWSGDYIVQKDFEGYGRNFSMYLARGIVNINPHIFMRLMWNDTRTKEYNQYSKSRSTEIEIDGTTILDSTSVTTTGTKAIRSETNVPLTKFTIETRCLMHVRALDAPDDGYVIFSRSLDTGDSGTHSLTNGICKKNVDKQDNQILWGINILKFVPNHPNKTDLISLSHVSTPNVPGFFGRKIAIMGIEDFFKNIRKIESTEETTTTTTTDGIDIPAATATI